MHTVLFLCYNNAGRSLMAEAIFNARAAERGIAARAESAGLVGVGAPGGLLLRVMQETASSMEGLKPKPISADLVERANTIVAFGHVNSNTSAIKFVVNEDWPTVDPAGLPFGEVCAVRDDIASRVDDLLDRLAS